MSNQQGYLYANTVLFAHKVMQTIEDMCGIGFKIRESSLTEKPFSQKFTMAAYIHVSGTVQGDYIISMNEELAAKLIGAYQDGMSNEDLIQLRDDYSGFVKEALNIAVGQSVVELEQSFGNLTFISPTIVYGKVLFPEVLSGCVDLDGEPGQMQCGFSLNMANLKIGQKLEEALKDLEIKTKEAMEAKKNIENMLTLYPAGLVTINSKGDILPGHSRATATVVGLEDKTQITGKKIEEVLGLDESRKIDMYGWLDLAFEKYGEIPFKDIVGLCGILEFKNCMDRILKTDWFPIVDDSSKLEKLLLVIEDVTKQRELEQEMKKLAKQHQDNLDVLSAIINLKPDEVTDFVYDTSRLLTDAQNIVTTKTRDRDFINSLFRTFHTIKSSSGQYHFKGLQSLAHEIEDYLRVFRDDNETLDDSAMSRIKLSLDEVKGYVSRIDDVRSKLGGRNETIKEKAARTTSSISVNLEYIDAIVGQLEQLTAKAKLIHVDEYLTKELTDLTFRALKLRFMPLSFFQASLQSLAKNSGDRLRKKVDLTIGADIDLDVEIMRKLHTCFVHMINNAIDHGIEDPEVRRTMNKLERGLIILSGKNIGNNWAEITVEDDGKGIDIEAIKKRLEKIEKVSTDKINNMTKEELCSWLLRPGFSTKPDVTEISGRGVGLDVVDYTIKAFGGKVKIESESGKGTKFILTVPIRVFPQSN